MATKNQSVMVEQRYNPRFDSNKSANGSDNAQQLYHVMKTVNTLEVAIGQYLTPDQVQSLIDKGVTVTVQPVK